MNSSLKATIRSRARLLITLLALGSGCVQAANCDMQLSNSTVNYGRLSQQELNTSSAPPQNVSLGKKQLILNINCTKPTRFALRLNGASAPAPFDGYAFSANGGFTMQISVVTVDGIAVALAKTDASGHPIQSAVTNVFLEPGYGVGAVSGNVVVVGKHLIASLEVETRMPRAATGVRDRTQWEGSAQLELIE